MDVDTEFDLLFMYLDWLEDNKGDAQERGENESEDWFHTLLLEVQIDINEVAGEWVEHDMELNRRDDGEWIVKKWVEDHSKGQKLTFIHGHWEGETPPPRDLRPG